MLLAVIQGLAEFLPISSSGHLVLGRAALGLQEGGLALDVALHVGTLVAVILAYRKDVIQLFRELLKGRLTMWIWLIVATLPAAVIGLALKDKVEMAATKPLYAAGGLLVTAALLLVGESRRPKAQTEAAGEVDSDAYWGRLRISDAIVLGFAQALAIFPGISRSGSTISVAFLRGIDSYQAARLSFLMSLPAVSGAAILELPDLFEHGVSGIDTGWILAAMAVSAVVGFAALRTLIWVLSKGAFRYFAGYCVALSCVAFWFLS
ncbi:MAG: undecaprenyl-diphosphate phosphatase [Planctomycetes bacterium]|nr:undecaprenyl-diphosphate phosphatase [Planctomycetota bacterium]